MNTVEKKKVDTFVKNYFKSLRIKQFLILGFIWIIMTYLTRGKEAVVVSILIVIIVSIFAFFIFPDYLQKETERAIEKYYNNTSKYDDKLVVICNLKKFGGPTFGTLHIDEKTIEFNPFKENLQNERFLVQEAAVKNIQISLLDIKRSVFNRIFFKELHKGISISCDEVNVLLQTPQPEKTIEKIKKRGY
ncbi:hypothetical protein SH2C18_24260 [Clostridium sediminicola]|uniref:hypothetical protein n=1 Tax=Clostridium sediminicola TaxID=3114879 RepID=UPI0031F214B9